MKILKNNKIIKKDKAKVSIFSDAFMFGFGVFETLRTYDRKIFELESHLNRLFKSAKKIGLIIKYNEKEIKKMTNKLVKTSKHKNQLIKIICIENEVYIISKELKYPSSLIKKGVAIKTIEIKRNLPDVKSISYLSSYISNTSAKKQGFYEALLLDSKNYVYEGAYSNIFWFEKETLCTISKNILPGITREVIKKISPFKIKLKNIKINELIKKKEIFLTQTSKGIIPVNKINKLKINNGIIGEKTKKLIEIFNEYALKI